MTRKTIIGLCVVSLAAVTVPAFALPPPQDVLLKEWTDAAHPSGFYLGETTGVSWGDFDSDGYPDIFACQSGKLWHNLGGTRWELAADLNSILPPAPLRYGSSFADFDNDGLLDIATAPRDGQWGDERLHLLKNLGGGANFTDIAGDSLWVDTQPHGNAETLCFSDVNGDGFSDLFVPVYPDWAAGPGNFFLQNAGAGPGGWGGFSEISAAARLDNVIGSSRPEGAQFADVDFDGDVDLYSNGILYQNNWTASPGRFIPLSASASGIGLRDARDEGAMFFDYDLDGDQDLFVVYTGPGVYIWENRGDGTFFAAETAIIDSPLDGMNLGMSAEDWDNDGDVDFTTREVFRRNMLMEGGGRHFTVATHSIRPGHVNSATPAWADWDKDGDMDCALGNWGLEGHLYDNTLYTASTAPDDRRYVSVRVVRDSAMVPRGLESEYGATVDVRMRDPEENWKRRKFVASSHGYLNQNEYTLHFALPPDPSPGDPAQDVRFDVSVDFPVVPEKGLWRVDPLVNPALGNIRLADLTSREIVVYRCGRVMLDGVAYEPFPAAPIRLTTTSGGLGLPSDVPLPESRAAAGNDAFIGVAFDTHGASGPLRLEEIIVDGQLDPVRCGPEPFSVVLWDVTEPAHPTLVGGARIHAVTSPRNQRSRFATDAVLAPGRSYRLVARATELRRTSIAGPVVEGPLTVLGGLAFRDATACDGTGVAYASVDPTWTAIAIRVRPSVVPGSDSVGRTVRADRGANGSVVLRWSPSGAPGFEVRRCSASAGPCQPARHAVLSESVWTDPVQTGSQEHFWYLVDGAGQCVVENAEVPVYAVP